MDSSNELASIYAIGFVIRLYLIFLIGVQTFDVTRLKFIGVQIFDVTRLKFIRA
jgi:hypothetical protein